MTTPTLAELIARVPHFAEDGSPTADAEAHAAYEFKEHLESYCPRCSLELWHREALGMVPEIRNAVLMEIEINQRIAGDDSRGLDAAIANALAKRLGEMK